jgi:hypothetical protein
MRKILLLATLASTDGVALAYDPPRMPGAILENMTGIFRMFGEKAKLTFVCGATDLASRMEEGAMDATTTLSPLDAARLKDSFHTAFAVARFSKSERDCEHVEDRGRETIKAMRKLRFRLEDVTQKY